MRLFFFLCLTFCRQWSASCLNLFDFIHEKCMHLPAKLVQYFANMRQNRNHSVFVGVRVKILWILSAWFARKSCRLLFDTAIIGICCFNNDTKPVPWYTNHWLTIQSVRIYHFDVQFEYFNVCVCCRTLAIGLWMIEMWFEPLNPCQNVIAISCIANINSLICMWM